VEKRPVERRLAAILAADVVGFSRLMEADEEGTLAALRDIRQTLIDPNISLHQGRIVKTAGDSVLVEFPSVVEAVASAVEVQSAMLGRHAGIAESRRIRFRVGINIGDVIVSDGDIFGDGVNVAARLQALAEPDGVLVSAQVHDGVAGKLTLDVEDAGELSLKNISRPVRAYRLRVPRPRQAEAPPAAAAAEDRPSLVVLPFNNLSGDPAQELFADGLVEDLTTLLARLPGFFVIARNSSFTYKGAAVDIRSVGRELGVRYALEGSVQKAGNRIRINSQLIEAVTGKHVWAERYDRDVSDLFAIQDEITQGIYGALRPHLLAAEADYARRKPPESLDAWGLTIQAQVKWYDIRRENVPEVELLARRAIAQQPSYALPHALLAQCLAYGSYTLISSDFYPMGKEAYAEAQRAIDLGGDDPEVLAAVGNCFYFLGLFHKAHAALERAVELNPNSALACGCLGLVLAIVGRPDDGIAMVERAIRLSPRDPQTYLFHNWLGFCHFVAGRHDQAASWTQRSCGAKPRYLEGWIYLAAALAEAGRRAEAARAIAKARELAPQLRLAIYKRPRPEGTLWPKLVAALEKAGLPE
jgi:adenylate cyclase